MVTAMTLAEIQFIPPDLRLASAEIFVAAMACLILIVDLRVRCKDRFVTFVLTLLTLFGAAWLTVSGSSEQASYTFSGMYRADLMGDVLKVAVYATVAAMLVYSRPYAAVHRQLAKGEFYVLTLFATLGMMVMISASHFLTVYIGIELMSLSLYALVALNRDSVASTEAAMKYFVLGALASGLLLYGISMIYGATGTLDIASVASALFGDQVNRLILSFGLVFVVCGLAFKLGLVPFHMWVPDVYQGAPTVVTLLIGSAPKLAAFAVAIRVLVNGLLVANSDWQSMFMILAVLSMAVGNFAAVVQTNIKRMLAYSAISHMGFMVLGLVAGVIDGDLRFALNAYSSSMFYVITYALTSAGAFGFLAVLSRAGVEVENISDLAGLNRRSSLMAGIMMMLMFSMAGIPFFVGFFAKFSVIQAVVAGGYFWLAIAAVFFSLVGAFYYLRVVKVMYFDKPLFEGPISCFSVANCVLFANGIAVALLGVLPHKLMWYCAYSLSQSI